MPLHVPASDPTGASFPPNFPSGIPAVVPASAWSALGASTDRSTVFAADLVGELPEPVRRWLVHAIAPGTRLLTGAQVTMRGRILLGRSWRPFRGRQRTSLGMGFVWAARTRILGLPVTGFDRFTAGTGEMHWQLLGRFRLLHARSEEVTRSAAGRHAAEVLALLPAAALDPSVAWEPVDARRARVTLLVGGEPQRVTVTVGATGRLRRLEMQRWGAPVGHAFGRYRFEALCHAEECFDGYRIPTLLTAGWDVDRNPRQPGQFIRYRIGQVRFR